MPIGIIKTLVVYHPEIYFIEVRAINVQMLVISFLLTHIILSSFLCDIGKQCRSISDATKHLVWSGSSLFVLSNFNSI